MFVSIVGCDSIPKRDDPDVLKERNRVIEAERDDFKRCIATKNAIEVSFNFALFRRPNGKFGKKTAVPFNPDTSEDEIKIDFNNKINDEHKTKTCLRKILKKLEFESVYPTVRYMESHEYKMRFNIGE